MVWLARARPKGSLSNMAGGQPGQVQDFLSMMSQQGSMGGYPPAQNQAPQMQYPQQGQANAPVPPPQPLQMVPDQQSQQALPMTQAPQDPQTLDNGNTPAIPQQQGNKPISLSQFRQPQGIQVAPNPTASIVQRYPQQR